VKVIIQRVPAPIQIWGRAERARQLGAPVPAARLGDAMKITDRPPCDRDAHRPATASVLIGLAVIPHLRRRVHAPGRSGIADTNIVWYRTDLVRIQTKEPPMTSRTLTAVLPAPKEAVFDYLSRLENLPDWATDFARELKYVDGKAKVVNGLGEFHVAIDADRRSGVIDMYAGPTEQELALFPTRVVPLGDDRSAYSFTMFKAPEMPDELFESQYESLRREFDNIRDRFRADSHRRAG
jgi:hypothetical protein